MRIKQSESSKNISEVIKEEINILQSTSAESTTLKRHRRAQFKAYSSHQGVSSTGDAQVAVQVLSHRGHGSLKNLKWRQINQGVN